MAMRHHVETLRVKGLQPGCGTVTLKESGQPLASWLDAKSAEGWDVVSVSAVGTNLEVVVTLRRPG
ncbi:MAG: hypothetical protein ACXWUG_07055 [Polyangiales bacterium]